MVLKKRDDDYKALSRGYGRTNPVNAFVFFFKLS